MYCPQCGATNEEYAHTCASCGLDINEYKNHCQSNQAAQTQPVDQSSPYGQQPYQQPYQQSYQYQPQQYQQQQYQTQQYQSPPMQYQSQPAFVAQYQPAYSAGHQGQYPVMAYPVQTSRPYVPSHMGWAIATTLLCCLPAGIAAVVYASQVSSKLAVGDYDGALHSSKRAKMWSWISFGIGLSIFVIAFIIGFTEAANSPYYYHNY